MSNAIFPPQICLQHGYHRGNSCESVNPGSGRVAEVYGGPSGCTHDNCQVRMALREMRNGAVIPKDRFEEGHIAIGVGEKPCSSVGI